MRKLLITVLPLLAFVLLFQYVAFGWIGVLKMLAIVVFLTVVVVAFIWWSGFVERNFSDDDDDFIDGMYR